MAASARVAAGATRRWPVISALGVVQILAWGSSYYLPAILAGPIAAETGWPLAWVVGGLSCGLLVAAFVRNARRRPFGRGARAVHGPPDVVVEPPAQRHH